MVDKVKEKSYHLGVWDTLVDHRGGSRGQDLEEISYFCCRAVLGGWFVMGHDKVWRRHSYKIPGLNCLEKN